MSFYGGDKTINSVHARVKKKDSLQKKNVTMLILGLNTLKHRGFSAANMLKFVYKQLLTGSTGTRPRL